MRLWIGWVLLLALTCEVQSQDKVPVPAAAKIAEGKKLVQELFGDELAAAKTAESQVKLARQFFKQVDVEQDEPEQVYAVISQARELAVQAGSVDTANEAIALLASRFAVNAYALRYQALQQMAELADSRDLHRQIAQAAAELADSATDADEYEIAKQAIGLTKTAAREARDLDLLKQAGDRLEDVVELATAYDQIRQSLEVLKKSPTDSDANLAVGKYRCFVKGDWKSGISMLALGSDASLKDLARQELGNPKNATERAAIADAWWSIAVKQSNSATQRQVKRHAASWYQRAISDLRGLTKAKAEKRIAEVEPLDESASQPALVPQGDMYATIKACIEQGAIEESKAHGFSLKRKKSVQSPEKGGVLIGFDLALGGWGIRAYRPIFQTAKGQLKGSVVGIPSNQTGRVIAKRGYAVGAISVRAGLGIDGMSLTFMKIEGDRLNPADSYTSPWVGKKGGSETTLGGDGRPVIGVVGYYNEKEASALGVIQLDPQDKP